MRVRPTHLAVAVATAGLAILPSLPAVAGTNVSIAAAPSTLRPGDTTTVNGTTDCASVAYTVTLTFTDPEGAAATATASETTDAAGEFTQAIDVPETAVAGEPASVQASVECSGGTQGSNTVPLTVQSHEGTLDIDPTSGPTGTEVEISGTNCWGDDIAIAFTDDQFDGFVEVEDVTLNEDRTFTASFTIPEEAGPGDYFLAAECPGTDFEPQPFRVTEAPGGNNPSPRPTPSTPTDPGVAPPAPPVVDVVNFTG